MFNSLNTVVVEREMPGVAAVISYLSLLSLAPSTCANAKPARTIQRPLENQ